MLDELYEIVKSRGTTSIFRLSGIDDAFFVSVVLNGAETHLFAGSIDRADKMFDLYAKAVEGPSRSCGDAVQGVLFN